MRRVLVAGGGAAGLMAAVSAARAGAKVTLLEKNRQAGKKILATGNGRCNLTNVRQEASFYRGEHPEFALKVLESFGMHDTLRLFSELGIFTKNRNGYLYPYSDQASSVAEILRMEAERQNIKLALNTEIERIEKRGDVFAAVTKGWTYEGDALILAAGSAAAPETGSDGSGYRLAGQMGHRIIRPLPALVQLRCRESFFAKLAGLRMDARIRLYIDGKEAAQDQGEVQFTKNGVSGIPVFQISRWAVKALDEGKKTAVSLDLLPLFSEEELEAFLEGRIRDCGYKKGTAFLTGLFPEKMGACLIERAGIGREKPARQWNEEERKRLAAAIKNFCAEVTGSGDFAQAQVCSGGVDTEEICPETMESRLTPGLYFAGEVVDIDGACGGYNLQWAWSSGYLAGRSAAEGGKG